MPKAYRPIAVAGASLAVFAALFVLGGALGWWTPAANERPIGEISRWCERVSGGIMREPLNTLGNLAFVITGLVMFVVLARDTMRAAPRPNPFIGNQPLSLLYASAAVFLGPGSMLMHGSHTFFGAWFDNLSMVAYILIPWLYNVSLLGRWQLRTFATVYVAILVAYSLSYWLIDPEFGIGLDLFELSIGLWMVSEVLVRWSAPVLRWLSGLFGFVVALAFGIMPWAVLGNLDEYWWFVLLWIPALLTRGPAGVRRTYIPWFWLGLAAFVTAFAIWGTGKPDHPWCAPDSFIQAHAVWHLLSAAATWCFFLFLRTQHPTDSGQPPPLSTPAQPALK